MAIPADALQAERVRARFGPEVHQVELVHVRLGSVRVDGLAQLDPVQERLPDAVVARAGQFEQQPQRFLLLDFEREFQLPLLLVPRLKEQLPAGHARQPALGAGVASVGAGGWHLFRHARARLTLQGDADTFSDNTVSYSGTTRVRHRLCRGTSRGGIRNGLGPRASRFWRNSHCTCACFRWEILAREENPVACRRQDLVERRPSWDR